MDVELKIDAHNGVMQFSGPLDKLPQAGEAFLQICPWARKPKPLTPQEQWQAEHDQRAAEAEEKRRAKLHRSLRGVFNLYGRAYQAVADKALNDNGPATATDALSSTQNEIDT